MITPITEAGATSQTGGSQTRRLDAVAAARSVIRRRPPIEVLVTLAVILVANVTAGIAAVRGDHEADALRSLVQTLGTAFRVAFDVFLVALGLVGVAALLVIGLVLPDLLAPVGGEDVRRRSSSCEQPGAGLVAPPTRQLVLEVPCPSERVKAPRNDLGSTL